MSRKQASKIDFLSVKLEAMSALLRECLERLNGDVVKCPECQTTNIEKYGKTIKSQQRYRCKNKECNLVIFLNE